MFRNMLSCISQLWVVLCESMSYTTSQTPSSSPLDLMASTSSQVPSSTSSSTSPPTKWDVFLSFRGEDTRYNFTSHLYSALDRHGIRTFMDDPELRSGEVISDVLLKAIQESKTYIVVFSENYASSSWCLDELVEILNCHKTMQRLIIPVFYKIDPSIVRRQIGRFEQAFIKHELRFAGEMKRVKNWRLTLRQVSDKSGKHIYGKRSEADIINEIVDDILLEINPTALDVAKYPVGLDSRVKAITTLLTSGTKGVIKIGIYGMGGIGKTTLAKALFNQLLLESFKGSCFLANVREISGTLKGLQSLQEQLINDVLKVKNKVEIHNVEQGIKLIEARICSAKILVVIDDLDDHQQFETLVGPFASGSVLILTTRDEEILDKIEVETKYRYRVNELDDAESLALFSRHAFRDTKPDNSFMVLSKDIICHAGGLPLALEVFGSYLYMRSERGWKSYIEKLQRIPNSSIQQRLVVSLDALELDDPMLKKLFLDIACFFIGRKKEQVAEIMGTYYSYADNNIDILKKRCLLTINDRDELRMHDLLQDIGREISRNNYPDEPGKHSRLWVSKDICDVLKKHEGTEAIEGIKLEFKDPIKEVSFATEAFRRMRKLRFLYLKGISLTGDFEQTLEDLRWFHWDGCPLKCLPFNFCPQKLVILELPHSKMTIMREVNMVSQVFKNLKTLNMLFSLDLTTTPDFTKLPYLETLDLQGCKSLEEVHISIGSLERLVFLNLRGCVKLISLPDSICNLRSLEILSISYCEKLETLPDKLWEITRLRELNASWAMLKKLPDIGSGQIELSLQKLDLCRTGITALPSGFSQLSNLQSLYLGNCNDLFSIPKLPPNLKQMNADRCASLERLPNLSNLKHLEELDLECCSRLTEILGSEDLTSLRKIKLAGCNFTLLTKRSFQTYLGFGHQLDISIRSKEYLCLISQSSKAGSTTFWRCSQSSSYVDGLTMCFKLPPNVSDNYLGTSLCFKPRVSLDYTVETSAGTLIRNTEMLDHDSCRVILLPRSIFSVTDVDARIEITTSGGAEVLNSHLLLKVEVTMTDESNSTIVDELKLVDPKLQDFFLDIACFFIGWKKKEVVKIMETCYTSVNHYIDFLKERCVLQINNKCELEMHDRFRNTGRKIARNNSFDEPEKHSRLWLSVDMYDVLKNHTGTTAIEGIVRRKLGRQDALEGKSFFTKTFKRMSKLRFLYFKNVNLIGSFEQTLENLRWLCWDECPLEWLPSEFNPQKLVILELPRSKLKTLWEPNMVSHVFDKLTTLNMSYSLNLMTTPDFTKLPSLETLNFEYCESLESVHISIGILARLFSLNLHGCGKLEALPHTICNLEALIWLDIGGCSSLDALPIELGNIDSLTELYAKGLNVLKLPVSVGRLSKLVELRLGCSKNLKTLPNIIGNLSSLEILDISGCERLETLPDQLWKLTRLRELDASGTTLLTKLPDIEESQIALSLKKLNLSESSLTSLPSGFSQLSALGDLDLTNCGSLFSIPKLPSNLKQMTTDGCRSMERLPNLSNLKQLEILDITDCISLTKIVGLEELTSLEELHLIGCNPSLLAYTLTKHLFQIYFGFGHTIEIYAPEFPDWISPTADWNCRHSRYWSHRSRCEADWNGQSSYEADCNNRQSRYWTRQSSPEGDSGMSLKLPPNVSHNLLGMILCFQRLENHEVDLIDYHVENTTTRFSWDGYFIKDDYNKKLVVQSMMVIVPRSIFPIKDGDEEIKSISFEADINGIHLLYESECDSTTANVEDERSNPSASD